MGKNFSLTEPALSVQMIHIHSVAIDQAFLKGKDVEILAEEGFYYFSNTCRKTNVRERFT